MIPANSGFFIDNRDVTELADTSDYFISYVPKDLKNGRHTIKLEYHTESDVFLVTSWDFDVVDPSKARSADFAGNNSNRPLGRIELGARSQKIAGNSNDAYTARSNISGSYGIFRYSLNGFFTSQESDRLQPQNRYGANLQLASGYDLMPVMFTQILADSPSQAEEFMASIHKQIFSRIISTFNLFTEK